MNRAQLGDIVALPGDDVVEHLAQARGDGAHFRAVDIFVQFDRSQPLVYQLAGEVDIGTVAKPTTTCEKPNFETDRMFSTRGNPLIACSIGKVMRCSTSSGPKAGAAVLICTCTGVVSGKASISRYPSEIVPAMARANTPRITNARCRNDNSMMWLSNLELRGVHDC